MDTIIIYDPAPGPSSGSGIEIVGWSAFNSESGFLTASLTDLSAYGSASNTGDGGTIAEGDVVLAMGGYASNANRTDGMNTAGYSTITSLYSGGVESGAYYKVMGATPDVSARILYSGNSQDAHVGGVVVLRGVDTTAIATAINQADAGLNPGSITPTVAGSHIYTLVLAGSTLDSGAITVAKGVNMTLVGTRSLVDNYSAGSAIAYEPWTSGAFDPAVFTTGGAGTVSGSVSISVVVEPA